jgi:hypothetical protein
LQAVDVALATPERVRPAVDVPGQPASDILEASYDRQVVKVYVERGSEPPIVKTVVWRGRQ